MSIAGGGDFTLGGVTYRLADVDQPIKTVRDPVYYPNLDIAGSPGARSAQPNRLYWSQTDWSGGEGSKVFDPQDPTAYYTGKGNGRNPGYMTATPLREDSSVHAADATAQKQAYMVNGGGKVWVVNSTGTGYTATPDRHLRYSSDVNTWTSSPFNGTRGGSTLGNEQIPTAMVCSSRYLFIATWDGTTVPGYPPAIPNVGSTYVYWLDMEAPTVDVYNFAEHGSTAARYAGMALLSLSGSGSASSSILYGWTGQKLWSYDLSDAPADIANTVEPRSGGTGTADYTASTDKFTGSYGVDFFSGIVSTDNSVVFFNCDIGDRPLVYEYKDGTGRPIWGEGIPRGFSARAIGYALGNVYLVGTFNTRGAVFALNLVTYQPFFVGFLRGFDDLTQVVPTSVSPGLGTQVLVGCQSGEVFVIDYNGDQVAISQLDQRASVGASAGMTTFGLYRVSIFNDTTAKQIKASRWSPDDVPSTGAGNGGGDGTLTSGMYDFQLPFEKKCLLGFRVISEALSGAKTVTIAYDLDDVGSFTSLTTLPSTSDGITQYTTGDHFIPVSGPADATVGPTTTKTTRILRMKQTVAGGAKVYSWTAEVRPMGRLRSWELYVDLGWNAPGSDNVAIRGKRNQPEADRAALRTLCDNGAILTFKDGTAKHLPGSNDSYSVYIEEFEDDVRKFPQKERARFTGTEGVAFIKLRVVSPG